MKGFKQFRDYARVGSSSCLAMVAALTASTPAWAQQSTDVSPLPSNGAPEKNESVGDIIVTGTYIARSVQDQASPVSLIGAAEIQARGIQSVEGLLATLPSNGLSKRYSDATGSSFTAGTSQVNLRGLGFSSTLTLIDNKRQTLSPTPDTDGASFVDINPIPLIMIERLEVLTDGASATYGSDAVAGVANFIMRKKLKGIEVRGSYGSTLEDSQADRNIGVAGGATWGRLSVVAGVEWLHRTPLGQSERSFSDPFAVSGFGMPGSFLPVGATSFASAVRDPNCAVLGGIPAGGLCRIKLSKYFDLVPREDRVASYAVATLELGNWDVYAQGGYAWSKVDLRGSPSYLNTKLPIVPANNPGNLVANGGLGVDAYFLGRPFGNPDAPGTDRPQTIKTYRAVLGAKGDLGGGWNIDNSIAYSRQDTHSYVPGDVNVPRFSAALNCMGGPNNNLCFNPFGSAYTNPALANSPAVIADFARASVRDYQSSLLAVESVVSGGLAELPGGTLSVAIGGQYRRETLAFSSDLDQQRGELGFFFSGPNFKSSRDFFAGFVEIDMPVRSWLTANIAGRVEHIGGFGDTFNPKASLRLEPADGLVFRGSVGSSFRAPSLSQITSINTTNTQVTDPLNPAALFFTTVKTVPSASLKSETSLNYNLGIVWKPAETNLTLSVDYFNYNYKDLIAKEDVQAIINANPLDPRIDRLPGSGLIQSATVSFINAQSVKIDGFDFAADWRTGFLGGEVNLTARATYTANYKADIGHGGEEQLAGYRNYQNFAPPIPRWRSNLTGRFTTGPHSFSATITYIDSVKENYANLADPNYGYKIGSFTTVDAQYALDFEAIKSQISIGVQNLFGEEPPAVKLTSVELSGFDRQLHDPRGTIAYVSFKTRF